MEGSSAEPVDGRIQFEPDAGPPITRSRFTSEHTIYNVELVMRDAQWELLQAWYAGGITGSPIGLGGGVSAFQWSNPDGTLATYTVKFFKRPVHRILIPAQVPHPDNTNDATFGGAWSPAINDLANRSQRTLRVSFSLIQASFYVP
jgi:hypothetical protein